MINWRHLAIELPICASVCALLDSLFEPHVIILISACVLGIIAIRYWIRIRGIK